MPSLVTNSSRVTAQLDIGKMRSVKIIITNYHAFKLRETAEISKTGRALLKGRGEEIQTLETEGQMIKPRSLRLTAVLKQWLQKVDLERHPHQV